eukprot:1066785-Prymnesium_polylepis.1
MFQPSHNLIEVQSNDCRTESRRHTGEAIAGAPAMRRTALEIEKRPCTSSQRHVHSVTSQRSASSAWRSGSSPRVRQCRKLAHSTRTNEESQSAGGKSFRGHENGRCLEGNLRLWQGGVQWPQSDGLR